MRKRWGILFGKEEKNSVPIPLLVCTLCTRISFHKLQLLDFIKPILISTNQLICWFVKWFKFTISLGCGRAKSLRPMGLQPFEPAQREDPSPTKKNHSWMILLRSLFTKQNYWLIKLTNIRPLLVCLGWKSSFGYFPLKNKHIKEVTTYHIRIYYLLSYINN